MRPAQTNALWLQGLTPGLTLSLPSSWSTFSQPLNKKCIKCGCEKFDSIIIFHLSKLWKAIFFILCDVKFLVRLQGKFDIDHSWEWTDAWSSNANPSPLLKKIRLLNEHLSQFDSVSFNMVAQALWIQGFSNAGLYVFAIIFWGSGERVE